MRLTIAMLEAIVGMASRIEAGGVDDAFGYDTPENQREYDQCLKAGDWAGQQLRRRKSRSRRRDEERRR